jgi:hypothetical protein
MTSRRRKSQRGGAFHLGTLYNLFSAQYDWSTKPGDGKVTTLPKPYEFIDENNIALKSPKNKSWALFVPSNCHIIIMHRGTDETDINDIGNNVRNILPTTHHPVTNPSVGKDVGVLSRFVRRYLGTVRLQYAANCHSELNRIVENIFHNIFSKKSSTHHYASSQFEKCVKRFYDENPILPPPFHQLKNKAEAFRRFFLKKRLSTIGHSQGSAYCYLYGDEGLETIVYNPAPIPSGATFPKNLYVLRTPNDPISMFGKMPWQNVEKYYRRKAIDYRNVTTRKKDHSPTSPGWQLGKHVKSLKDTARKKIEAHATDNLKDRYSNDFGNRELLETPDIIERNRLEPHLNSREEDSLLLLLCSAIENPDLFKDIDTGMLLTMDQQLRFNKERPIGYFNDGGTITIGICVHGFNYDLKHNETTIKYIWIFEKILAFPCEKNDDSFLEKKSKTRDWRVILFTTTNDNISTYIDKGWVRFGTEEMPTTEKGAKEYEKKIKTGERESEEQDLHTFRLFKKEYWLKDITDNQLKNLDMTMKILKGNLGLATEDERVEMNEYLENQKEELWFFSKLFYMIFGIRNKKYRRPTKIWGWSIKPRTKEKTVSMQSTVRNGKKKKKSTKKYKHDLKR